MHDAVQGWWGTTHGGPGPRGRSTVRPVAVGVGAPTAPILEMTCAGEWRRVGVWTPLSSVGDPAPLTTAGAWGVAWRFWEAMDYSPPATIVIVVIDVAATGSARNYHCSL